MIKYVRVHLESVHEARTLVLLIAILSLRSIFHPKNFVKLICPDQVLLGERETK